ncbi:DivIVA domain-containing protein [Aerococcus agrisoli]|uniref:DivIVA domain-containing protein n=1 Tax=Aerococcus agrisoli TaxID=2487350 RepID=A0A3N4GQC9_9LACT|nr:DivIVA domain-containing protein [Aerococcus agrisoli]RPA60820.1 DivIVA domain-containing protein [Aerococcus agrisoli]
MRASELKDIKFKQKISGYGKQEVDEFINKVRVAMEKLEESNKDLQEKLNVANKEVDAAQRKESTVNRSIFVAQEAADRLREEALNEASLIVERAEEEAQAILTAAAEKATVVNTETDNLQEAARTYLHQSFGMVLQAKAMYEDPRWENLFFEKPVGEVPTPQLDEILKTYDLPVRSDKGPAIFDDAAAIAEKEQRKEEFFNNDIPAIPTVIGNVDLPDTGKTTAVAQGDLEAANGVANQAGLASAQATTAAPVAEDQAPVSETEAPVADETAETEVISESTAEGTADATNEGPAEETVATDDQLDAEASDETKV